MCFDMDLCLGAVAEMQGNNGRERPRDWCWPPNEVLWPEKHPPSQRSPVPTMGSAWQPTYNEIENNFLEICQEKN